MEVTQFTYFQQVGGLECYPVTGELTYGLERITMYSANVESMFDLVWTKTTEDSVTYGDVFLQNEQEMSAYNFEHANTDWLCSAFDEAEVAWRLLSCAFSLHMNKCLRLAIHLIYSMRGMRLA